MPATTSIFALPHSRAAKAEPALIAADERHFARIAERLLQTRTELSTQLDSLRRLPGGSGQQALERDQQIHRLTARLRLLDRFGLDLCLGRIVPDGAAEPVYIGRLGLADHDGGRLLIDWRSPAAEPFFAATHADPMGLVSRRRYRWTDGAVTDFWDEVFSSDITTSHAALDDQSAFIASLGGPRTARMRDVLGTIAADQDAIVRTGSDGALVVDGGPGTGKTVVALHRTAYLLYSDPRLGHRRGGVLFLGPHPAYLAYVADVLPALGEEGVLTATLADLVPQGSTAQPEPAAAVAALKADLRMVGAIEPAVAFYEQPPAEGIEVETAWASVWLGPDDWAEAFGAPEPGAPHNDARDEAWEALLRIAVDKLRADLGEEPGAEAEPEEFDAYGMRRDGDAAGYRRALAANRELVRAFERAWPVLDPADVVGDLWSVPAYLRMCAPWLSADQVRSLHRDDPQAWTEADLPILDAARHRLGDPAGPARRRRREAADQAHRAELAEVIDDLIASDDSDLGVMSMLRGQDLRAALVDPGAMPAPTPDRLAGPFAHIVVDEAQELTDAQWQMVLRRCPSRSLTIVGDPAQARHGFAQTWQQRLAAVGIDRVTQADLRLNYRTPSEVMDAAEPVIRAALPQANVPTSIRTTGVPVRYGAVSELGEIVESWLATHAGVACVIGDPTFAPLPRVSSLAPVQVKGLEFDLVVLVCPERFGDGVQGAVDRYVAMTRTTGELIVLVAEHK